MKQETIGSKGTVLGFRPLIGEERWLFDRYSTRHIAGGKRPLLYGERGIAGGMLYPVTSKPLPPPAVETFEAHGHIWYKHTPGDECPVEPDVAVDVLWSEQMSHSRHIEGVYIAKYQNWSEMTNGESVIGYRFPDYPAVHATSQQAQHVEKTMQSFQHCDQLKQQLTSIYNGWVYMPPETVAECIADVAAILPKRDACDAAFCKWWATNHKHYVSVLEGRWVWDAAWKSAKESK